MDITKALRHIQAHTNTQTHMHTDTEMPFHAKYENKTPKKKRALTTFWVLRAVAQFFLFLSSFSSSGTCASGRVLFSLSDRYTQTLSLYMIITYLGIRLCAISLAREHSMQNSGK